MRILYLVMILFLAAVLSPCEGQSETRKFADEFYGEWKVPPPPSIDSEAYAPAFFLHDVPTAIQGEVLAQVLDRACSEKPKALYAISRVLACTDLLEAKIEVPDSMKGQISGLAESADDPIIRSHAVRALGHINTKIGWDVIVAALNDSDEGVRVEAIETIFRHPEGGPACSRFVTEHHSDPAYAKAVGHARDMLKDIQEAKNGSKP